MGELQQKMKRFIKRFRHLLSDPSIALRYLLYNVLCHVIRDDRLYISLDYFSRMKKFPDLKHPKTFNEKLQWLKLNDRRNEYTRLVDKYEVKDYVKGILGEEAIIPTLGVWDRFDDIDFEGLPDRFVLKTTHDSGGVVVVSDKGRMDMEAVRKKLEKSLKTNYYTLHREYPYKNVKPRIIAEKYMIDEGGSGLKDYKFFCFGGEVKFFKVDLNRFTNHHANYYDRNWNLEEFWESQYPVDYSTQVVPPCNFDKMLTYAEKLSEGIPFVRVDLYNIDGDIYFGELTFFPTSGAVPFSPPEWNDKIGDMLKLPCDE